MPKITLPTIAALWDEYAAAVMPKQAPPEQRREMRRAFYTGTWSLLNALRRLDDTVPDEEGAAMMDAMHQEVTAFLSQLGTDGR